MKKSLIALAALAAAGTASAQFGNLNGIPAAGSVQLFGVVDATWAHGSGSGAAGNSVTRLTNSGLNSSRLGFRGTEDLGGGMSASFWLEAGVNNDDGTGAASNTNNQAVGAFVPATGANAPVRAGTQGLTFNRQSWVSLNGGWGSVRLGRDYTPQFVNLTAYDPFGTNGVGTTLTLNGSGATIPTKVRASNSVAYLSPNLGGFTGTAMYYLGENASNAGVPAGSTHNDGKGYGLRLGYGAGPVDVGIATSKTKYAAGDQKVSNIGGSWDFGVAKLMAQYDRDRIDIPGAPVTGKGFLIGGLAPVGSGLIRASYSRYKADVAGAAAGRGNQWALGYVHNLSKRTALYATYARVTNKDGAAFALNGATTSANARSTGYDLGLRHSF